MYGVPEIAEAVLQVLLAALPAVDLPALRKGQGDSVDMQVLEALHASF